MQETHALAFPCSYPIKVIGCAGREFEDTVLAIIHRHCPDLPATAIHSRASKNGTFCAITITITAQSQAQLDNIYQDLTAEKQVLMAL